MLTYADVPLARPWRHSSTLANTKEFDMVKLREWLFMYTRARAHTHTHTHTRTRAHYMYILCSEALINSSNRRKEFEMVKLCERSVFYADACCR